MMDIPNNLNYREIHTFDVAEIANEISSLDPSVWDLNQSRQNNAAAHEKTKSIFINDVVLSWKGIGYPLQKYFISEKLNRLTEEIQNILEAKLCGKVGRTIYINLPAGERVRIHKDYEYYLTSVHRCHIPIVTNDLVEFFLNGEIINMKAGVCYEINNSNYHGANNKSSTNRIHLLMDIIPHTAFKS